MRFLLTALVGFLFVLDLSAQNQLSLGEYLSKRDSSFKRALELGLQPVKGVGDDALWLQYLGPNNHPVYYGSRNSDASRTTSTEQLQVGGDLGLELTGANMLVGVWDGGQVQSDHVELVGRTSHKDNSNSSSSHATHVTGTILASGVNPNAKGMATEASSVNYDWNADLGEMAEEAEEGLMLSNHSYGTILGWRFDSGSWEWFGDPSVSETEDYRFGLYSNQSRALDQIVHSNPYYLPLWAAGNDRSDVGSGVGAPGDGPFDILGPSAVAKNLLTVGAVSSVTNGDFSPQNIEMSSFSSWGPTDDGRIKPDLVGMGVSLFSTWTGSSTAYSTISGTSMATPNVTGSLALLHELYHRYYGEYMLASSIKALAIHTAREAGNADGPDYQFGWGLLNANAAAKFIQFSETPEHSLDEGSLSNGETKTYTFSVNQDQKVKATIVWTDVPGNAITEAVLDPTDLALINDLDIEIQSPSLEDHLPWVINPETQQVSKGDNFRDNVEVVEFVASESGTYELTLSHKGTLHESADQAYSLLISVGDPDQLGNTYVLTENENQLQWMDSEGLVVEPELLSVHDQLIIRDPVDYTFSTNVAARSLTITGSEAVNIDLGGFNLELSGNIVIKNEAASLSNGSLKLVGDVNSFVDVNGDALSSVSLSLEKSSELILSNNLKLQALEIVQGNVSISNAELDLAEFIVSDAYTDVLELRNLQLTNLQNLDIHESASVSSEDVTLTFIDASSNLDAAGLDVVQLNIVEGASLNVQQISSIDAIENNGALELGGAISVGSIFFGRGTSLELREGSSLTITGLIDDGSDGGVSNVINSVGTGAAIVSNNENKFCLENTTVSNVSVSGETKFVLDGDSVTDGDGWIISDCALVLSANFSAEKACSNGVTTLLDLSDGTPNSWTWTVHDVDGPVTLSGQNPEYQFVEAGTYMVELEVSDGDGISDFVSEVEVQTADIGKPEIVPSGDGLMTTVFGSTYQWFLDGEPIDGATDFVLENITQSGSYTIELYSNSCTTRSEPFVFEILGSFEENRLLVYPTVVTDYKLNVDLRSTSDVIGIVIYDTSGKEVLNRSMEKSDLNQVLSVQLDPGKFDGGVYILKLQGINETLSWSRFIVN